jgi:hypothetical protein
MIVSSEIALPRTNEPENRATFSSLVARFSFGGFMNPEPPHRPLWMVVLFVLFAIALLTYAFREYMI